MKDKTRHRERKCLLQERLLKILERLDDLYAKVDCLIVDNEDVFLIKANISSANSVCAEMERLALKETNEERSSWRTL